MSNLIRLSPTGIEYGDFAWNFASGCGNNAGGKCKDGGFNCWAYSITQRFPNHYPNGFKPTVYPEALLSPLHLKKPSRILCAFMGDLFWECPEFDPERVIDVRMPSSGFIDHDTLRGWIFNAIKACPQHRFYLLTKQPQNLAKFSPFPSNCYVGVTATNQDMFERAIYHLRQIKAKVIFMSFEPLLERIKSIDIGIGELNWVIIGACTGRRDEILELWGQYPDLTMMRYGKLWTLQPRIEWVQNIAEAADRASIPIFFKDNLKPLFRETMTVNDKWVWAKDLGYGGLYRQELPGA